MARLQGRVALVTGAASGTGKLLAEAFVAEGARVLLADVDEAGLGKLMGALGHNATDAAVADVQDEASVTRMVNQTVRRFGRIDIAANTVAAPGAGRIAELPLAEFERIVRTTLTGAFLCMKHEARQLIAQGSGGSIINVTTSVGMVDGRGPKAGDAATCAAHAGVEALTLVAALELAAHGIRVNAIRGAVGAAAQIRDLGVCLATDRTAVSTGETISLDDDAGLNRYRTLAERMGSGDG